MTGLRPEDIEAELPQIPICELPIDHSGPCKSRNGSSEDCAHLGETVDGIRELAVIDRYYARDDLSEAGLDV